MIVYCKVYACKHNKRGSCCMVQPVGAEFITIEDALMGPMCEDCDIEEDDDASTEMQ